MIEEVQWVFRETEIFCILIQRLVFCKSLLSFKQGLFYFCRYLYLNKFIREKFKFFELGIFFQDFIKIRVKGCLLVLFMVMNLKNIIFIGIFSDSSDRDSWVLKWKQVQRKSRGDSSVYRIIVFLLRSNIRLQRWN